VDVGYGDNVAQLCVGDVGVADIVVRYIARNTGSVPLNNCTVTESNPGIHSTPTSIGTNGSIPVGGANTAPVDTGALTCTTQLTPGEPDTATLNCLCGNPADNVPMPPSSDSANYQCCGGQHHNQVPTRRASDLADVGYNDNVAQLCVGDVGAADIVV